MNVRPPLGIGASGTPRSTLAVASSDQIADEGHLAIPRQGHVLSTVAETYGGPIRTAVACIERSLQRHPAAEERARLFVSRWPQPMSGSRSDTELLAWSLVAVWVVGVAAQELRPDASLADSEAWFFGRERSDISDRLISPRARASAEAALHVAADPKALGDLLPYILDPHGPGSRLSVRSRPETKSARARKRMEGVFYTPGDVADYMAAQAFLHQPVSPSGPTVFDPACGTGVFLRAALAQYIKQAPQERAFEYARTCIFGTDIDPWAADAAAFTLLHSCWPSLRGRNLTPIAAWHALRNNIACADAVLLDPARPKVDQRLSRLRRTISAELEAGTVPGRVDSSFAAGSPVPINDLFPELFSGPNIILANPPYADVGTRYDLLDLSRRFRTVAAAPGPNADLYPIFVEQMVRLSTAHRSNGVLVVPLSIAFNASPQFVATRALVARTAGTWRFTFFDREPHALFGEDVKTRNAIVAWTRETRDTAAKIYTGPLHKWRGYSRKALFLNIRHTQVLSDIRAGIPKIDGARQAAALAALARGSGTLQHAIHSYRKDVLSNVPQADRSSVFVGATAYNFLNVFMKPPAGLLHTGQTLSEHPLHVLQCSTPHDALRVFAVLASGLAFWWWHVHADGFHVTRRWIEEFPVDAKLHDGTLGSQLADLGEALWQAIRDQPTVSLNRGRVTIAFSSAKQPALRGQVDSLLVDLLKLPGVFTQEIEGFATRVSTASTFLPNSDCC